MSWYKKLADRVRGRKTEPVDMSKYIVDVELDMSKHTEDDTRYIESLGLPTTTTITFSQFEPDEIHYKAKRVRKK